MSTHSLFSPSKSAMWIACPGSMAFPQNQQDGGSSTFADDGTASHHWSGLCLEQGRDAEFFIGAQLEYNGAIYEMDETRASFCQIYIDDVRRRAIGGSLYVEFKTDLGEMSGTTDAGIYIDKHLIAEDLKYGTGEKVYASYVKTPADPAHGLAEVREINSQLGLYLLGMLKDMELLGNEVEKVTGVICQPRLGHIDEHTITVEELQDFGRKAQLAREQASKVLMTDEEPLGPYLNPGEKQCRWCRAKAVCPALARFVADEVRCDFETIEAGAAPTAPADTTGLARAKLAVPLVRDWCNAVDTEVSKLVAEGKKVIGPDGLPYKFVQGEEGKRAWDKAKLPDVEALLVGQLGPKAYAPQTVITAPQAGKLLDKKASKNMWKDMFVPLITRATGKPILTVGSDSRPPFTGAAGADEFEEDLTA